MKKAFILTIALASVPLFVQAYGMQSNTVSSSNTGSVTASSNEFIATGDSNAYSEVHTTVTSNGSSGGTSTVYIKTSNNGVVHEETQVKRIPPGGNVVVQASARAGTTTAQVRPVLYRHATTSVPYIETATTSTGGIAPAFAQPFMHDIWRAWTRIFGWFGW